MNKVNLSLWIEANYPATAMSIALRKPRYGVGVNDASYVTTPTVNGVRLRDPACRAWANILKRACNPKCHAAHPTYSDVTVCKEWHSFTAFRTWWLENYREGGHLDKDMLSVGNREYGPDSCIYVPQWLNSFTIDSAASRGELPIGVSFCNKTGMYQSNCSNPITGKQHRLGYFTAHEEAYEAWIKRKLELAAHLKPEMDAIDQRIYPNVVTIIKAAE